MSGPTIIGDMSIGSAPLSATLFIGNATKSDYEGQPNIKHQVINYFGAGYSPVSGRPQASVIWAKYFEATTEEPAEAASAGVLVRNLLQAEAEAAAINQTQAVTGHEADVLLQGRVTATGRLVGYASGPQLQALFGYAPSAGDAAAYYVRSAWARDAGSTVETAYGLFCEDPRSGGSGLVRDAFTVKGPNKILSEDAVWVGQFLTSGKLLSKALAGASKLELVSGVTAANYPVNGRILVGDTLATREVVVTKAINEGTQTVEITSTLGHEHAAGEPIHSVSAANIRYESGNLTTDCGVKGKVAEFQQLLLSTTSGTGYARLPYQTVKPSAPPANFGILYFNSEGKFCLQLHEGGEVVIK